MILAVLLIITAHYPNAKKKKMIVVAITGGAKTWTI
jgi:hypothetical protein